MIDEAYVFLDANVLLHLQRPDSIDWCALCGAEKVFIVIYPLLMSEITKAKDGHPRQHMRARARSISAWLRERLAKLSEPIRPGVTFTRDSKELRALAIEMDLDWQHHDDRIIAHAISHMRQNRQVLIVTNDGGLEMKLPDFDLAFLSIPEKYELPPEQDADKLRADKAERDLRELRSRRPEFKLICQPVELASRPVAKVVGRLAFCRG